MLIDWFTVLAQIANFLILVWLMKRYLYHPILNAIDAREKRIAAQISDAANKVKDAVRERELFAQKNRVFDQERDKLLKAAQDSAETEKQKLLDIARKDADAIRSKRNEALLNESKTLQNELATLVQNEAFSIARQTLAGLADINIETQMTHLFVQHLSALDANSKSALVAAMKDTTQSVLLRSAYAMPLPSQDAIKKTLCGFLGVDPVIQFELDPGLVCGIELSAGGQKLAWSITDHLDTLDSHINLMLAPVVGATGSEKTPPKPTP